MNPNNFTYTAYSSLLRILLKSRANLCFQDFAKGTVESNFLILRHDVDYSPKAALRMAELEAAMGIKATYFLLLSSPYYNLFSKEYALFPTRLTKIGHEVGLHYDLEVLEAVGGEDLLGTISREIDILSKLAGSEITSIAMHKPSFSGIDPFRETAFINAYDAKYTEKIAYFSDSCGAWRDKFAEHLEQEDFPMQMQLLIHPIFWTPSSTSRWQILDSLIEDRINGLRNDAKQIKDRWSNYPGVIQHERRSQLHIGD